MPGGRPHHFRPLRPLLHSQYICPPCRLRCFTSIPSRDFGHSIRLLHGSTDSDTKTGTSHDAPDDKAQSDSQPEVDDNAANLTPSTQQDLHKSTAEYDSDRSCLHTLTKVPYSYSPSIVRQAAIKAYIARASKSPPSPDDNPTSKSLDEVLPFKPLDGTSSFQPLSRPMDADAGPPKSFSDFMQAASDGGAIQSLKDAMTKIKIKSTPGDRPARKKGHTQITVPKSPERIEKDKRKQLRDTNRVLKELGSDPMSMDASQFRMQRLDIEQPPVPRIHHGLDRVLFNQGVYRLQDERSHVYNFDPYLEKIMPVSEFDYDALTIYKTSSQDPSLSEFAKQHGKKYVGSTSSMTSTLAHFHYLLSAWRKIDTSMFSRDFPDTLQSFTALNRAPTAIFLRFKGGTYAVDADKEYDGANVLMLLGRSMEKLLTMPTSEFERYRKGKSNGISEAESKKPESYHYSTLGDFLLRSQLDAHDPRLPGTGVYDLKTRAVLPIRMQSSNHEPMTGYEITRAQGQYESYEREYYDMMRSTALKYSLQARMGHMDGIFVSYHNVKRIFGFQYISMSELDQALHGQANCALGDKEFGLSIGLLNQIFDKATEKFPDQSIRFHFETKSSESLPTMRIFAEPMSEEEIDTIQNSRKAEIAKWERALRDPASMIDSEQLDEPTEEEVYSESGDSPDDFGPESTNSLVSTEDSDDVSEADGHEGVSEVDDHEGVSEVDDHEGMSEVDDHDTVPAQESEGENEDSVDEESEDVSETMDSEIKEDESSKPLLGMTLSVRSKVNGQYVERPKHITKRHNWTIDYALSEMASATQAWREYNSVKGRRKSSYKKANKIDKSDPDSSTANYNDQYIQMLRDMSMRGGKRRQKLDKAAAYRPTVVVGKPYDGKSKTDDVSIESVDDYLTWLYAEKGSSS